MCFYAVASAFRKLPSIYVFSYFPFCFEGRIWDMIVSFPDHCLSFYFGYYGHKHIMEKVNIGCNFCLIACILREFF